MQNRIALLVVSVLLLSWMAPAASAAPHWQTTSFRVSPANLPKLVAATEKLMSSEIGKTMPGTLSLMASVIDGPDPATHSFITAGESVADREGFMRQLEDDPAWAEFQSAFDELTEPGGGTSRMVYLKNWGTTGEDNLIWELHAFAVTDTAVFTAALDTLMASPTGTKFPGEVYLSSVRIAGLTPVTHLISVGFETEAEAEIWNDTMFASEDWTAFQAASGAVSSFQGSFLLRTLRVWGSLPEPE